MERVSASKAYFGDSRTQIPNYQFESSLTPRILGRATSFEFTIPQGGGNRYGLDSHRDGFSSEGEPFSFCKRNCPDIASPGWAATPGLFSAEICGFSHRFVQRAMMKFSVNWVQNHPKSA